MIDNANHGVPAPVLTKKQQYEKKKADAQIKAARKKAAAKIAKNKRR
jgi:hypothetical protein